MPVCKRNGCGKSYEPHDNCRESCSYHPQGPIFHEGLKGWSCCSKRVTTFEEFLAIPGCAVGQHNEEIAEILPDSSTNTSSTSSSFNTICEKKVYEEMSTKMLLPGSSSKTVPLEVEAAEEDPLDAVITAGTKCKRRSCEYSFKSDSISRNDGPEATCTYHPGTPIFHEASKGWSCCRRRVLEFDEFLKIRGCKTGNHLFFGAVDSNGSQFVKPKESLFAEIRHDWYQSPSQVILTIYTKGLNRDTVKIVFSERELLVEFPLPGSDRVYRMKKELFQPIIPESSTFNVYRTKIELKISKANGISWAALEATDRVTSWTTFGIDGKTGTVGGKEMFLSNDSPLLSLNR